LLQQRSDGGQWGLPGGSVEIGESVTGAVAREVREETGLTVVPRRLVGVYSDPELQVVRYPDGNVWHYVNVCFECVVRGGSLTTCDETLALEWVTRRAAGGAAAEPSHPHPRRPGPPCRGVRAVRRILT